MSSLQRYLTKLIVTSVTRLEAKVWNTTAGTVPSSGHGGGGAATAQNEQTAEKRSMYVHARDHKEVGGPDLSKIWTDPITFYIAF